MTSTLDRSAQAGPAPGPKPITDGTRSMLAHVLVYLFVAGPTLAMLASIPLAWSAGWLGWVDVALFVGLFYFSGLGITIGYHRHFTHGSFKAKRWMRVLLAIAGSSAVQGPPIIWVADHRRHHAYSDKEGDPHSPWLYGSGPIGIAKGFWHAHMGWMFDRDLTNKQRFAPDLLADKDIVRVSNTFILWTLATFAVPALLGGLITWSWWGAFTGFLWAGVVRIAVLHHVTWSVNSICHMIGEQPYQSRDRARNFWPLAVISFGESWHNLHHADPTCARHGVGRGQIDVSARLIWLFEKFGWVWNVRWPTAARLTRIATRKGGTAEA